MLERRRASRAGELHESLEKELARGLNPTDRPDRVSIASNPSGLGAGQAAVRALLEAGPFRDYDLHAFLELDESRLTSPTLEEEVVEWVHARFEEVSSSGLLEVPPPGSRGGRPADNEFEEV